jgi:hypothetical protein
VLGMAKYIGMALRDTERCKLEREWTNGKCEYGDPPSNKVYICSRCEGEAIYVDIYYLLCSHKSAARATS